MRTDGVHGHEAVAGALPEETVRGPAPEAPGHDEEFGQERFLRPFAVTAGDPDTPAVLGPEPSGIDMLSLVVAARVPGRHEWLRPERETILGHALRARTVVELAAEVHLPVGQVRGIVAAMIADGSLQRCGPSRPLARQDILHAVLVGLRSL
ncbi:MULTISPECIES: DUF742 domain-containing protein [Nocardiopsis]|uniref:DUF742 domain-containing protein n=1 Tax=Nocardiopsis sinuspersici TaxID=501010 RepID=A0A1V3C2E7_9ACTN|nr:MULTISPECIES: DUF742 domain-containing protein [Nocardiopsis]OOC54639.1 hypothetical protein NOSIN_13165 [Nocardiopsis sinuspersici]